MFDALDLVDAAAIARAEAEGDRCRVELAMQYAQPVAEAHPALAGRYQLPYLVRFLTEFWLIQTGGRDEHLQQAG